MNPDNILKILKNKNNQLLLIILIIGMILIFASGEKKTETKNDNSEEQRLEEILSDIEGVGRVSVMITYRENVKSGRVEKEAKGVVITADGAREVTVKTEISNAASAALDLPLHKVCVFIKE